LSAIVGEHQAICGELDRIESHTGEGDLYPIPIKRPEMEEWRVP
jgi:hypothetical protein